MKNYSRKNGAAKLGKTEAFCNSICLLIKRIIQTKKARRTTPDLELTAYVCA